ncbi:hypothetical protein CKN80_12320 [Carnobacterium divergens]|uniref:M20/M25/M40 family metallo-hydrolase n=1 Tax=Carnobacterium divergens TaxID=2748 RepID=UPI00107232B0|nr:M20/M25/M40 family metallo-hydrolase [Carnobacterium divergens]TFJ43328.1 hypothetical protein CKN79_12315 [Carnobacterium divergens]TFJ50481.1 hypothetical protein CKN80_12320 [Carnobacterium divergens]
MLINEERLIQRFVDLVKIDSETKQEEAIQPYLKSEFEKLGLEVTEDQTKGETGFGANNLIAVLAGDDSLETIFFSCHMDTVMPGKNIQPIIKDGVIQTDGTTILGADDKAGIAILFELIQTLKESEMVHCPIEFVITVGEESGLVGAKAFDVKQLSANYGFVLDTGGPVGSITVGSPTQYRIEALIKGVTAHAGVAPEKGISAVQIAANAIHHMKLGRIDEETTANIGLISGGTATNIVMDRLEVIAEARSLSKEACENQVNHMKATFETIASEMGGSAAVLTKKNYDGYRFTKESPVVQVAAKAIMNLGIHPNYQTSGGGSDANIFNGKGKPTTNLSIGYEKIHTVHEYIPTKELKKAAELAYQIVTVVSSK